MGTWLRTPGFSRARVLVRGAIGMTTVALGSGATAATARATSAIRSDCSSARLLITSEPLANNFSIAALATPELPGALGLDAATATPIPYES